MMELLLWLLRGLGYLLLAGLLGAVVAAVVLYVIDVNQNASTIRRNYPVLGRMRYALEYLGEFLRQYFFAMDREELPFNRAQRNWVYQASKGIDTTQPFGSTRNLRETGNLLFAHAAFPVLEGDAAHPGPVTIGPGCEKPYTTCAFFHVSAMSYGAISRNAVLALSRGAARAGIWMNTGEGGLSPYHLEGGADLVFQIGTAHYGVRDPDGNLSEPMLREIAAHETVRMFEIKLSQGAKPGKGGLLPGTKVTEEIARIRGIPVGEDSVSPNRHAGVTDADQLLDLIGRVRRITGKPTGIKFCLGAPEWLDDLFLAIERRGEESAPDFVTIDSKDGGTGAAPMSLIDFVGMPIRESLPMVVDGLVAAGLRHRVKVIASGKLVNPGEVAWALCAGADFVHSARGFMFALGCIQALQCNRNTCPTGITTHDPRLMRGLDPAAKAERVRRYAEHMAHEVGSIAHACGVTDPRKLARRHCRVVSQTGRTIPMTEIWPDVEPGTAESARGQVARSESGRKSA